MTKAAPVFVLGAFVLLSTLGVGAAHVTAWPGLAPGGGPTDLLAPVAAGAQGETTRGYPGLHGTTDEFTVHVPPGAREPIPVLLAFHGMGGSGDEFAAPLYELTDPLGWMVVAPTFAYGDWRDPGQVTREERRNLPRVAALLDRLPEVVGAEVKPEVRAYGFSRGGQTAQRLAFVYPGRVSAVAVVSSGTYTLPWVVLRRDAAPLPFPFGMADCWELFGRPFDAERLTQVPFWIGVGSRDSDPADVPREWDPYIGDDRLERARRFAEELRAAGVRAEVAEFAGAGHAETGEMRAAAVTFLAAVSR